MSVSPELLSKLRCPLTRQSLVELSPQETDRVNQNISQGRVTDHVGSSVDQPIDGGLHSAEANRLYPVRQSIPSFIVEESIVWPITDELSVDKPSVDKSSVDKSNVDKPRVDVRSDDRTSVDGTSAD